MSTRIKPATAATRRRTAAASTALTPTAPSPAARKTPRKTAATSATQASSPAGTKPARKAARSSTKPSVATPAPTARKATSTTAKRKATAQAKALAPEVPLRMGSTPKTKFRGNADLFGRLLEDHDHHRALLAMITATRGDSKDRKKLFKELVKELKSHAAAEEQALWSSVMRNPKTTDDARHAVAEHKEIDKMLDDLAARDMASSGWLRRFAGLHEEYLHHIKEEEQEQFVAAQKHLTPSDIRYMKQVFNRRKAEEKAAAKVTPKLRKKAH